MEFSGIDLTEFIVSTSYIGVFLVIFMQLAFLFGVVLPGTSFLLAVGFLASQGYLDIRLLILFAALGSLLGDSFGYMLGRKTRPLLFKKKSSRFLNPQHINRTREFYSKHGGKTIVLARFVHFARTFAPKTIIF